MVVIATPVNHVTAQCCDTSQLTPVAVNPVSCAGQNIISAEVSTVNGTPVTTRIRSIAVTQGTTTTINWQLHDQSGTPLNLTPCFPEPADDNINFDVAFRMREYITNGNTRAVFEIPAEIVDRATGKISVALTDEMTKLPGIYYADFCLIQNPPDLPREVLLVNTLYLIINRSTLNESAQVNEGPPSIAEIRLHLRDSSPAESFLLDNLMFDDAEIALAIARPIQYWNEVPPPLSPVYTTQSFPFRYHWLEGICANLFFMVAEQYRRNQLPYSAGGVSVDDQNKEASYERAGQARWQAYREWVRATKAAINLEGCWGSVTSNYKYSAYTDAIRIRY